jgi:hypothetical protein
MKGTDEGAEFGTEKLFGNPHTTRIAGVFNILESRKMRRYPGTGEQMKKRLFHLLFQAKG